VSVNQEATVFASIAPWQKGKTNLWTFIFDQLAKDPSIGGDKLDFRSPENLNLWLVGDALPDFCPVLRAFLRSRMAKRQSTYDMQKYLARKLGKSEEEIAGIMDYMREAQSISAHHLSEKCQTRVRALCENLMPRWPALVRQQASGQASCCHLPPAVATLKAHQAPWTKTDFTERVPASPLRLH
jgi:hypothetical protein